MKSCELKKGERKEGKGCPRRLIFRLVKGREGPLYLNIQLEKSSYLTAYSIRETQLANRPVGCFAHVVAHIFFVQQPISLMIYREREVFFLILLMDTYFV